MDSTDNSNYWAGSEPPEELGPQPFLRLPWTVGLLALLLIATHFARTLLSENLSNIIVAEYGFIPAFYSSAFLAAHHVNAGSLFDRAVPFVSYMFIHGSWTHVLINTLWLLAFGPPVARRFGAARFFLLFILSGIAGAAAQLALSWGSADPIIGASAGVAGLMAICFRLIGQGPLTAQPRGKLAPLLSRQVLTWTAIWVVINIVAGLTGLGGGPGAPQAVAWQAHLGGYFAGLLLCGLFDPLDG
ncbi:MAG TPA: rhomboid family intramembrane serine protease [Rhizomicrobium sp.]|nr:rhomboid family intramembrane serine protease [Rhizomicrobium sp.]